jgi:hypothetical protein
MKPVIIKGNGPTVSRYAIEDMMLRGPQDPTLSAIWIVNWLIGRVESRMSADWLIRIGERLGDSFNKETKGEW